MRRSVAMTPASAPGAPFSMLAWLRLIIRRWHQTGSDPVWTTFVPDRPVSSPLLTPVLATSVKFVKNWSEEPFFTPPMLIHLLPVLPPEKYF